MKVNGIVATKATTQVAESAPIILESDERSKYVSRGAHKLLGVLDALGSSAPRIEGQRCLDAGASTGGFTDVLLSKGAREVVAVDVGYGQLAWKLRQDARVKNLERTNIRYLKPVDVGTPIDLVVADLSFISLRLVLPALHECAPEGEYLLMVKPQFEVGKGEVGRTGVVWDEGQRTEAVYGVAKFATELGLRVWAVEASPLPGPAGNVEYFLALSANQNSTRRPVPDLFEACVSAVERGPHPERKEEPRRG